MNLDNRLSAFSDWRGKRSNDGAGLWHLLSGCPTGDEVGIAWLATLCQTTMSSSGNASVSGTAVSTAGRTEWQVIAHETGHNFGAIVSSMSFERGKHTLLYIVIARLRRRMQGRRHVLPSNY
jgi:hypothetical protein